MKLSDFKIGENFTCSGKTYRCTDVGTRVVVGIPINWVVTNLGEDLSPEQAEADGWFNGPPYAVAEVVFDEDDLPACEPTND